MSSHALLRIAIFANVPLWTIPGLEHLKHGRHYATWLEPLVPALENSANAFDIHWVTLCKETRHPITHRAFGQTFHIIPRGKLSVSMASGFLMDGLRVRRVLRRIQPDLLHVWGSEEGYAWIGSRSATILRIFTLQGCLTEYVRLLGGSLLFRIQAFYERIAANRYRFGTAESPSAKKLLFSLNKRMKVRVVDYGVTPEFFEAVWEPAVEPQIVFVGGITKRKGIRELINVASRAELSHIRFQILGEGPLTAELSSRTGSNVEWMGASPRTAVVEALSRSWGLVIPTHADTGPTVIKEARVIGLPVVTTTAAGASCYIMDTGCGHVISPGDENALATAILSLCQSKETCLEMGKKGWKEHRHLLHPSTTAASLASLYRQLLVDQPEVISSEKRP